MIQAASCPSREVNFWILLPGMVLLGQPSAVGQTTITSLTTTQAVAASPLVRSTVQGTDGTDYRVTYDGRELRVQSFTAGGRTYVPTAQGSAVIRRNTSGEQPFANSSSPTSNPTQVTAWNAVVSTASGSPEPHTVRGQYLNTMDALFTSQNLWTGTENLFVNTAAADSGNVINNIERMDYIFANSFLASSDSGFVVFERGSPGVSGSNGAFKMAAITGMVNGLPDFTGSKVVSIAADSYGDGSLVSPVRYDVFRRATSSSTQLDVMHNDNIGPQGMSGVYVTSASFVAAGTPLFGYAVFGADVTGTGSQLNNWNNSTYFPRLSTMANDADIVAGGGGLRFELGPPVPEPSVAAMLAGFGLWASGRRRRA